MDAWRSELYHHGILGMKWGVRRYQNYDGSYTRKGLEHYNKSEEQYKKARANLASLKQKRKNGEVVTKNDIKNAKHYVKVAKNEMSSNYDQLKRDYKADEGKKLYAEGVTISSTIRKPFLRQVGVILGSNIAGTIVDKVTGGSPVAYIEGKGPVSAGVLVARYGKIGGTILNAGLTARDYKRNNQLRAYYGHSRRNTKLARSYMEAF